WQEDCRRAACGDPAQRAGDRSLSRSQDDGGRVAMLEMNGVDAFYGQSHVLHGISLKVDKGEIVTLLGANAAGKTTTMKTIFNLVKARHGTILFEGERIDTLTTDQVIKRGLALVPEGRRVFSRMSVRENLEMGAYMQQDNAIIQREIDRVYALFPRLKER